MNMANKREELPHIAILDMLEESLKAPLSNKETDRRNVLVEAFCRMWIEPGRLGEIECRLQMIEKKRGARTYVGTLKENILLRKERVAIAEEDRAIYAA